MRIDPGMILRGIYAKDLHGLGVDASRAILKAKLEGDFKRNHAAIAEGVKKEGDRSIREILYHLFARGTNPKLGGEMGNLIRDELEQEVYDACAPSIEENTPEGERIRIVAEQVVAMSADWIRG